MSTRIDREIRRVEKARELGPVARRNARQAMLAELRRLRAWLDEVLPAERRAPKPRRKRKQSGPPAGFAHVTEHTALEIAAAGVRVWRHPSGIYMQAPLWARTIVAKRGVTALRRAKRDITYRRATLAAIALEKEGS